MTALIHGASCNARAGLDRTRSTAARRNRAASIGMSRRTVLVITRLLLVAKHFSNSARSLLQGEETFRPQSMDAYIGL